MNRLNIYATFLVILSLAFIASCGSGEEIRVIEDSPQNVTERNAERADSVESFMQLQAGLLEPVDNLDPLFINNLSSKRVLSLIYDGLFTIDTEGAVMDAIAAETSVSDDSLTYTFTIKRDLFYHDSDVFISGVGRRVQAGDVKWAFERTARADVPDEAAVLLMNVEGYQDYFEDQRYIYDPNRRALDGVSGIQVVNSQTIRFTLIEPDPDFTKKLASPFLSIYPREAVQVEGRSLKGDPVGTGAYRFQERSGDTIILTRSEPENSGERLTSPRLNRIDFTFFPQESRLFQAFAGQQIHWIPEVGPETKRVVLNDEMGLAPGYSTQYNLHENGRRHVRIYLNQTRRANMDWLRSRLSGADVDSITHTGDLVIENPIVAPDTVSESGDDQYFVTYTADPYVRVLLTQVQRSLLSPDSEFVLTDIRTPISRTAIYSSSIDEFHEALSPPEPGAWMTLNTPGFGLSQRNVSGIPDTESSWKLFVEEIRVNKQETDTP